MEHPLISYLDKRGETVSAFAARIGVPQSSLSRALAGRRGLSLEAALLVERETGGEVAAACWLRAPLPPPRRTRPSKRPAA